MKKELILKISEMIGDAGFEIEAEQINPKVTIHFSEDGTYIGCIDVEDYQIERISEFFHRVALEVKKMKEVNG